MPSKSLVVAALALAGCAPVESANHLTSAASPGAGSRAVRYSSVLGGTRAFKVVEPRDWREMNRQVSPAEPKSDSGAAAGAGQ